MNWDDLRLFAAVAEQGSFSAAARKLRLGQPTLSRRIAELEDQVGEALFVRQHQGCVLTEAGERLLPSAQQMALWAMDAEVSLLKHRPRISGLVRITAPPGASLTLLTQIAYEVRSRYPALQLELLSSTEQLNLARGEADIALRTYQNPDADLITIGKVSSLMHAYASTTYAAQLKADATIADVDWITWSSDKQHFEAHQRLKANIPNFQPSVCSDDYNVQIAACCQGLGAMVLPQAIIGHPMLRDLVALPVSLGKPYYGEMYIQIHKRQHQLPRINAVLDVMAEHLARLGDYQALTNSSQ